MTLSLPPTLVVGCAAALELFGVAIIVVGPPGPVVVVPLLLLLTAFLLFLPVLLLVYVAAVTFPMMMMIMNVTLALSAQVRYIIGVSKYVLRIGISTFLLLLFLNCVVIFSIFYY